MSEKWELVGKAKKTKLPMPTKDGKLEKKVLGKKPTLDEIRKQLMINSSIKY